MLGIVFETEVRVSVGKDVGAGTDVGEVGTDVGAVVVIVARAVEVKITGSIVE